jgi:hypothetical protein
MKSSWGCCVEQSLAPNKKKMRMLAMFEVSCDSKTFSLSCDSRYRAILEHSRYRAILEHSRYRAILEHSRYRVAFRQYSNIRAVSTPYSDCRAVLCLSLPVSVSIIPSRVPSIMAGDSTGESTVAQRFFAVNGERAGLVVYGETDSRDFFCGGLHSVDGMGVRIGLGELVYRDGVRYLTLRHPQFAHIIWTMTMSSKPYFMSETFDVGLICNVRCNLMPAMMQLEA